MGRAVRGVTLIELIASIVIISVALVGLMVAVAAASGRSADPMIEAQAQAIAAAYVDEIAQTGFCDPSYDPDGDPATGCRAECVASPCRSGCGGAAFGAEAGRAAFDDICDYAGLRDSGATDRVGRALAGLEGYAVNVAVADSGVTLGNPALRADTGQVVRVDVTVTHAGLAQPLALSRYKTNVP